MCHKKEQSEEQSLWNPSSFETSKSLKRWVLMSYILNPKCLAAEKSWHVWNIWRYIAPSEIHLRSSKFKKSSKNLNLSQLWSQWRWILKTKGFVANVAQTWLKKKVNWHYNSRPTKLEFLYFKKLELLVVDHMLLSFFRYKISRVVEMLGHGCLVDADVLVPSI